MDPLFKEVGIYSALGPALRPGRLEPGAVSYREAKDGQVLEEGITEAGSSASFQAAGTSYATHAEPMIPFYIFYSMFGFQRTGDEFWAFGDARGRGFLLGATAGRTTLNGEGLQHEDGHSLVVASTIPAIRLYDPAFAYETAVIVRDGIERMYGAEPAGRLLLPDAVQRELRHAGAAGGRHRRRHRARPVPLQGRPRDVAGADKSRADARDACWPAARSCMQALRAQTAARRAWRRGRRLERAVVPAAAQRGARGGSLEPPAPRRAAADAAA